MWSGTPHWSSWPLQAQNFQNMNHEEVDWAELAKQWIQMKENVDAPPPPPPPPPIPPENQSTLATSSISPPLSSATTIEADGQVGGEMDMEIEDEKESPSGELNHQQQEQQEPQETVQKEGMANGEVWQSWWNGSQPEQANTSWGWGWPVDPSQTEVSSVAPTTHPTAPVEIPTHAAPVIHNQYTKPVENYSWVPEPVEHHQPPVRVDYEHRPQKSRGVDKIPEFHLDAAQRKKLPLWIREGLEKMEREKQRKLEKERELMDKEAMLKKKKEAEKHARRILKESLLSQGHPQLPAKSKFESDSESETEGATPEKKNMESTNHSKERTTPPFKEGSIIESQNSQKPQAEEQPQLTGLTQEEKMAHMMLKLRRWMTEILLDVTSSMMREVASEVIQKARKRALRVQVKKPSSALSSLSGSLGLSIYSDSEEEDNEDDDDDGPTSVRESAWNRRGIGSGRSDYNSEEESDAELRETIEKKKKSFEVIERNIYQSLQRREMEARRKLEEAEAEDSASGESSPKTSAHNDSSKYEGSSPKREVSQTESGSSSSRNEEEEEEEEPEPNTEEEISKVDSDDIGNDASSSTSSSSSEKSSREDYSEDKKSRKRKKRRDSSSERRSRKPSKKHSRDRERSKRRKRSHSISDEKTNRSLSRERRYRRSRSRDRRRKSRSRDRKSKRRSRSRDRWRRSSRDSSRRSRSRRRSRTRKYSRRGHDRSRSRSRARMRSRSKSRSRARLRSRSKSNRRRGRGRGGSHDSSRSRTQRGRRRATSTSSSESRGRSIKSSRESRSSS